jgi:hypothetical protein
MSSQLHPYMNERWSIGILPSAIYKYRVKVYFSRTSHLGNLLPLVTRGMLLGSTCTTSVAVAGQIYPGSGGALSSSPLLPASKSSTSGCPSEVGYVGHVAGYVGHLGAWGCSLSPYHSLMNCEVSCYSLSESCCKQSGQCGRYDMILSYFAFVTATLPT